MNISGNTILITGGATGIGYGLAKAFLEQGNEVIICGRRKERLEEVQKKHPQIHIKECDVANEKDRKELVEWVKSNFKNLNILVNNAGIQRNIDFTKGIDEYYAGENEIQINLEAPIVLSGLFIPHLIGKKEPAIINVSSGLGFIIAARVPVYSTTKAAIHAFSIALRIQLSKIGIKVYEIIPPAVDSELNSEGRAKRGNFKVDLQPDEFAAAVMKALKNDELEIGYGFTEGVFKVSREELNKRIQQMNSRW